MPISEPLSCAAVHRFAAIGTGWRIDTEQPLTEGLKAGIADLCEDFDRTWSRFRSDSLVTEIARAETGGRLEDPVRDLPLLDLFYRRHDAANRTFVPPAEKHVA